MTKADQPLPQDLQVECCLLGSLLLDTDNSKLAQVRAVVQPEMFMGANHRAIYTAVCRLADDGQPFADLQAVAIALRGELKGVRFDTNHDTGEAVADILHPLSQAYVPSCANAEFYAREVASLDRKRQAIILANRLTDAGRNGNGDFEETARKIGDELRELGAATGPSRRILGAKSIADLLAEPEEQFPWLIDGLLPAAGFSLLASKPKVGKSTFARCCVLAVARNDRFIGRACHGGPAIYVGLEDKPTETVGHFRALGASDEDLFVITDPAPNQETAIADLRSLILEKGAVLVVIDTLARLVRLQDSNDYAEVMRKLEPIIDLARRTGCHVMTLHHTGKNDRDDGDSLLGSTAFYASSDVVVTLRRRQSARVLSTSARYGTDIEPTVLGFDPKTRSIVARGSVADTQKADKAREVLDLLRKAGEPLGAEAIRTELSSRKTHVVDALNSLMATDAIVRTGTGKKGDPFQYAIPGSHSPGDTNGNSISANPINSRKEKQTGLLASPVFPSLGAEQHLEADETAESAGTAIDDLTERVIDHVEGVL